MKKSTFKGHCYLVIDAETDLPCACIDTFRGVQAWLGCSSRELAYMLSEGRIFKGRYTVEKIYL